MIFFLDGGTGVKDETAEQMWRLLIKAGLGEREKEVLESKAVILGTIWLGALTGSPHLSLFPGTSQMKCLSTNPLLLSFLGYPSFPLETSVVWARHAHLPTVWLSFAVCRCFISSTLAFLRCRRVFKQISREIGWK